MKKGSFRLSVVPRQGKRLLTGPLTLAGLAALAGLATRLMGLDHLGVSFCYFKALTGYACLTCGTTRALGHLFRFDILSAFTVQPLVTAGMLGIMLWGALDAVLLLASKRTFIEIEEKALRVILIAGVTLAALNWMYLLATGV